MNAGKIILGLILIAFGIYIVITNSTEKSEGEGPLRNIGKIQLIAGGIMVIIIGISLLIRGL